MTTHKDTAGIIERLESASGPDDALDHDIGMLVGFGGSFSASIGAALSLVPEGLSATIVRYADGRGKAVLWRNGEVSAHFDSSSDNAGCPASPATALCIAALRARANKGEG